jgi:hypothetical protein
MDCKVFSLFNTNRWNLVNLPACCQVVPTLYVGPFCDNAIDAAMDDLKVYGSVAAPGFDRPEGIVIWHTAGRQYFKKTLENDEVPKFLLRGYKG